MGLHKYIVVGCKNGLVRMEKLASNQNAVSKHIKDYMEDGKSLVNDKRISQDQYSFDFDNSYISIHRHDDHWGTIGYKEWLSGMREPSKWYPTFEKHIAQSIARKNKKERRERRKRRKDDSESEE